LLKHVGVVGDILFLQPRERCQQLFATGRAVLYDLFFAQNADHFVCDGNPLAYSRDQQQRRITSRKRKKVGRKRDNALAATQPSTLPL